MPDGIYSPQISAIIHLPKEPAYPLTSFYSTVRSVLQQYDQSLELITARSVFPARHLWFFHSGFPR